MTDLEADLRNAIAEWRAAAQRAKEAIDGLHNLRAQGHMSGLSTAYTVAANRLEALLAQDTTPVSRSNASDVEEDES